MKTHRFRRAAALDPPAISQYLGMESAALQGLIHGFTSALTVATPARDNV